MTKTKKSAARKTKPPPLSPRMVSVLEALEAGLEWPEILSSLRIPYNVVEAMKKESPLFAERMMKAKAEAPAKRRILNRLEYYATVKGAVLDPEMTAMIKRRDEARKELANVPKEGKP